MQSALRTKPQQGKGNSFYLFQSNRVHLRSATFGLVCSARQRRITRSQYSCLQEDPHRTLHTLFATLIRSYWQRLEPEHATGKYIGMPVYRPEISIDKLWRKEITHNHTWTLKGHQDKQCNVNPNYLCPAQKSGGRKCIWDTWRCLQTTNCSKGVWKRVWNSLAGLGQHTSAAIQTFQGAKSKVWVDVAHYNLNPPLTANRGK